MRARAGMVWRRAHAMALALVLSVLVSRAGCTFSNPVRAWLPVARLRGGMGKRNLDTADELEEDGFSRATDDVLRSRRLFKAKSRSRPDEQRGQGKKMFGMDEKDIPAFLGLKQAGGDAQGEVANAAPAVSPWGQPTGAPPSAFPGAAPGLFPAASGAGLFAGMGGAAPPSSAGTGGLFGRATPAPPGGAAGGLQGWVPSSAPSDASQGGGGFGAGAGTGQVWQPQAAPALQVGPQLGDEERRAAAAKIMLEYTAPLRELEQKLAGYMAEHLKSVQDLQVALPREEQRSSA